MKISKLMVVLTAMMGLASCGESDSPMSAAPVQLIDISNYDRFLQQMSASMTEEEANDLADAFADAKCQVKVSRIEFDTQGAAGEPATSSGVLMVPYGDNDTCKGPRPTVLYAHGTDTELTYDLSSVFNLETSENAADDEAMLVFLAFATQGFTVIAPNYAGYSTSNLPYHPYLDPVQQPSEMIDAYNHVLEQSDTIGLEMSPQLFVTGYSQGGYVAMATHKMLEESGVAVTASAPNSGPYAMLDFMDAVAAGYINYGAPGFAPMLMTSAQMGHQIYTNPEEVYGAKWASTAEAALPAKGGFDAAVAAGKIPAAHVFSSAAADSNLISQSSAGEDPLLNDSFKAAYLADAQAYPAADVVSDDSIEPSNKFRKLMADSDLRGWTPKAPVQLCGHSDDPMVYFSNTVTMVHEWSGLPTDAIELVDLKQTPYQPLFEADESYPLNVHGDAAVYCTFATADYFAGELAK